MDEVEKLKSKNIRTQQKPSKGTVLFVVTDDRGHFEPFIPLAGELQSRDITCELWCAHDCEAYLPEQHAFSEVYTTLPSTAQIAAAYKLCVSRGGDDDSSSVGMLSSFEKAQHETPGSIEQMAEYLNSNSANKPLLALKAKLDDPDVKLCIYENTWCNWVLPICKEKCMPTFGLSPTYVDVFRYNLANMAFFGFDGETRPRNNPADLAQPGE